MQLILMNNNFFFVAVLHNFTPTTTASVTTYFSRGCHRRGSAPGH